MSIPEFQEIMIPLLRLAADGEVQSDLREKVLDIS
jgi:hypothetical protein